MIDKIDVLSDKPWFCHIGKLVVEMAFIQDFVQNTYSTFTFKVNEKVRFSVDVCYPVITVLINFWTRQEHQENLMPLMFFRKRRWEAEIAFYCEKGSNSRGFVCATIIINTTHIFIASCYWAAVFVSTVTGFSLWSAVWIVGIVCTSYTALVSLPVLSLHLYTYTWCALILCPCTPRLHYIDVDDTCACTVYMYMMCQPTSL